MTMTLRRLYSEVYNMLMTMFIFMAAAILIQKLLLVNTDPWMGVLYCSPCFLAYFVGRFLHGRKLLIALPVGLIVSAALTLIPIKLTWELSIFSIIAYVTIPILTFILYNMPYISGRKLIGSKRFGGGLFLYMGCILLKGSHYESYTSFINIAMLVFLVFGLFAFNRENLRDAAKQGEEGDKMIFPPKLRRNNSIMLSAIILFGFAAANVAFLRNMARGVMNFFLGIITAIIAFIVKMTGRGDDLIPQEEEPGEFTGMVGDMPATQDSFIQKLIDIMILIVLIIAVLLILYFILKKLKNILAKLPGWLQKLLDSLRAEKEGSYVDETEDLLGSGGLRKEIEKNLTDFWDRITYRAPKFEDMPDNRAKVRFVYKNLLKKMIDKQSSVISRTPIELTPEADAITHEQTAEFMDAYNRARYGLGEVPDKDAEIAKHLNKRV